MKKLLLNVTPITFRATRHCLPIFLLIVNLFFLGLPQHLHAQTNEDCLACHRDKSLSMEKKGKTIPLFVKESYLNASPHKKVSCISCHIGFNPEDIPHKADITPVSCSTCHPSALLKHAFHSKMLLASKRAGTLDESCKQCHGTHSIISPKLPDSKFHISNLTRTCGECHRSVAANFISSDHGIALAKGIPAAPNCITCHSKSITPTDEGQDKAKLKIAQEKICLSCHLDNPDVRDRMVMNIKFIQAYENSVHGIALLSGNAKAANCVDCHGSHEMHKSLDPASRTNKFQIAQVCGSCHEEISKTFTESIHGIAVLKGNLDAPSCIDCHGEHNILPPSDPRSPVASRNVSAKICTPCHSSLKLSEKYGITSNRPKSFETSYHGLASRGGSMEVANCASCHGVHNIKPSSDPTSTIHKANLANTCGKCHPGANERFAIGAIHVTMEAKEDSILYWIATIYLILIAVIIGGMFIHNIADFRKKAIRKLKIRRGILPHHPPAHRLYVRMTVSERIQHVSLMVSFFLLVLTGFMLRFPDAWWVEYIRSLSNSVFELRSLIHRIAAVVMVAVSLYHIGYLAFTARGRKLFYDLLPRMSDLKDMIAVFKYNFGFSKNKPLFDRFTYIEKSEYWALVWGTIIMTITGVIMWFDNYFMGIFTKLGWDIARTIHYYEAWLAFLAIIVWHIYFVIFNPDVYPMNLSWIKGSLTEEEMAEEHPLELKRILAGEEEVELIPLFAEKPVSNDNGSKYKITNVTSKQDKK